MKVLVVDDEIDILEVLEYNLKKEGYEVLTAQNGLEALSTARAHLPEIVILDIMMPVMDGIETCRKMREVHELKPSIILFLTARGEEYSEVAGFEAGADDYLTKPIKIRVLLTRLKSLIARVLQGPENGDLQEIDIDGLHISLSDRTVAVDGVAVYLPKKEFEILTLLASKPGKIFTREHIYNALWGRDSVVSERTLDVHIRKLRESVGEHRIKTSKGVGYSMVSNNR